MGVKEEIEKAGLKLNIQKTKIMASSSNISWQIDGEEKQWQIFFSWAPKSLRTALQPWNERTLALCKKSYDKPRECIKKQGRHFANKALYSQSYGFSSNHVQMWELDHKEGWALKNWCFQTVVWEKTLESPLDCKEIKSVHPKGNQPWICIGRTDAEAPILWPSDAKSWLIAMTEGRRRWGHQRMR